MSQNFKSEIKLEALSNATSDTDRFLVSDSGIIKYRTGTQLLSDLGVSGLYVPYTGATGNVNLGANTLLAKDLIINHSSGSGVAASITKNGSGEALTVIKGSGSGNAMSVTGGLTSLVDLTLSSIPNATIDTDRFIVSDSGAIKYRTGAQVLSDIGAQAALTNPITGTGTTNYISKFTGTTALGNSQIFDNATNVGIGTASPADKLDINGAIRFRANTPSFTAVTNSGVIDFVPTTVFPTDPQIRFCAVGTATVGASMVFQTGTTSANIGEVMRITSTGNVGIGTTVPAVRLNVAGGDANFDFGGFANVPAIKLLKAGDEPTLRFYRPSGGTPNARIFQIQNTVGDLTFGYALANKYSESTFTEAMRITSVGNVGIGTTSPVRQLQVGGFSGNPEICIGSGTTGFGSLIFGDGASGNNPWRGFVQYNHATDAMIIGTNNASWLTLTNGGALGLNVNPTNTAGRFEASNDIVAYSSSDKRWKNNIKNIDNALDKLSKINGVEFDWIEDEPVHGNKGHDIGVIAQEIEQVLPDIVQTRESGMKAVQYDKIIPLLIESIKEQQKQIEELKEILNGITK
jgi:hypothetical protein